MKKLYSFLSRFSLLLLLLLCLFRNAYAGSLENISAVQFNTIKTSAEKMKLSQLAALWNALQDTMDAECETNPVFPHEEPYHTVCLSYTDGSKDVFFFFCIDDNWYMKAPDGYIYKNADFITDYIQTGFADEDDRTLLTVHMPSARILELDRRFENRNWHFFFTKDVMLEMENNISEKDAIARTIQKHRQMLILYEYAQKNGFELTEDEFESQLENYISTLETADNYEEIDSAYSAAGTSVHEDIQKSSEYYRIQFTVSSLYDRKYREFKDGCDRINDTECWSFSEYWDTFVSETIYSSLEPAKLEEIEHALQEAQSYCQSVLENCSP